MLKEGQASKTVYPDGTTGMYLIIDKDLHDKFKTKVESNGQKMKFIIAQLIEGYVKRT